MTTGSLIIEQAADVSHTLPDIPRPHVDAMNPLILLERAVEKGMDPAQLKALVDLHEGWRAARAKESFAFAMNAVQAEMPCIVRDAQNTQTNSRYVRMETVTHKGKEIYTRHGFSLSFSEDESGIEKFKRIVCLVRHVDGHSERHWIDLPLDGFGAKGNAIGSMNPVQAAISTGSYGQRVLTCRVFNITVADTDLDGQAPNPPADPDAPRAAPRARRVDADAEAKATIARVTEISRLWKAKNPEPTGDVAAWSARYKQWVMKVCDRVFNPQKPAEWTCDDMAICERELVNQ